MVCNFHSFFPVHLSTFYRNASSYMASEKTLELNPHNTIIQEPLKKARLCKMNDGSHTSSFTFGTLTPRLPLTIGLNVHDICRTWPPIHVTATHSGVWRHHLLWPSKRRLREELHMRLYFPIPADANNENGVVSAEIQLRKRELLHHNLWLQKFFRLRRIIGDQLDSKIASTDWYPLQPQLRVYLSTWNQCLARKPQQFNARRILGRFRPFNFILDSRIFPSTWKSF